MAWFCGAGSSLIAGMLTEVAIRSWALLCGRAMNTHSTHSITHSVQNIPRLSQTVSSSPSDAVFLLFTQICFTCLSVTVYRGWLNEATSSSVCACAFFLSLPFWRIYIHTLKPLTYALCGPSEEQIRSDSTFVCPHMQHTAGESDAFTNVGDILNGLRGVRLTSHSHHTCGYLHNCC